MTPATCCCGVFNTRHIARLMLPLLWLALPSKPVVAQVTAIAESSSNDSVANAMLELSSKDSQVRRDASLRLKENSLAIDQAGLERIAEHLQQEKDVQVRLNFFDMAAGLGVKAEPLVPALLDSLRKEHSSRRNEELHHDYRAALALASVGGQAVPGLKDLLHSEQVNVRAEAAMALGRIGSASANAVSELIGLMGDENERVRDEAVKALAAIGEPAVIPLVEIARNGSVAQKVFAIRAFGANPITQNAVEEILQGALESSDASILAAAIVASTNALISEERVIAMARENLGHSDELVRRSMINRLQVVSSQCRLRLKPELLKLLSHSDPSIAAEAAFLLQAMGPDVASAMIEAFAIEHTHIDSLAAAVALIGSKVSKQLVVGMQDPREPVREGCAIALGHARPTPAEALHVLGQGLSDRAEGVQLACLTALGNLGPRASSSIAMIEAELSAANPVLRAKSAKVFFQVSERNEATVRRLASLVDDESEDVQLSVIEVLHAAGPTGRLALPNVLKKLESSNRGIQSAVLSFIASHGRAAEEAALPLERLLGTATENELKLKVLQSLSQLGKAATPAKEQVTAILQSDADTILRVASLDVLSNLEMSFPEVRSILSKALSDRQEDVRRRALRAVRKYGPESRVFLVDLIPLIREDEKEDSNVMREIQRIEKHGLESTLVPQLTELLSSDNVKQLRVAIKFLGLASREEATGALSKLEELAKHSDQVVRDTALESLQKLGASTSSKGK